MRMDGESSSTADGGDAADYASSRQRVLGLMDEKSQLESSIKQLSDVLQKNGNVGMNGPLVDAEGYPRSDIDVYQVRHARQQIIRLQNDHKAVMKNIENGLHNVHATIRQTMAVGGGGCESMQIDGEMEPPVDNPPLRGGCESMQVDGEIEPPVDNPPLRETFAYVNLVSIGSPAEDAGFHVNDRLIQFGSIDSKNFRTMQDIAQAVQHSVGQAIPVKVLRNGGTVVRMLLTPKQWSGRGLIGCNIVPSDAVDR